MKTLYLIRHAKSAWDDASLSDIDRPLSSRGEKNAKEGAEVLASQSVTPELLISSPAKRALDTAHYYHKELNEVRLIMVDQLYTFSSSTLRLIILGLSDDLNCVALFGHEPALSGFINGIIQNPLEKLTAGSITRLNFEIDTWLNVHKEHLNAGRHFNRHDWDGFDIR